MATPFCLMFCLALVAAFWIQRFLSFSAPGAFCPVAFSYPLSNRCAPRKGKEGDSVSPECHSLLSISSLALEKPTSVFKMRPWASYVNSGNKHLTHSQQQHHQLPFWLLTWISKECHWRVVEMYFVFHACCFLFMPGGVLFQFRLFLCYSLLCPL